ncbi:hypothetical protein OB69_08285 [Roseivirga seohaensis subsp. aquiponti]|uniref:UDP-glycosyltransferase n=1 Tax=Roseivirga seohaensis subsp. aquiponti TaxID=1566026 RepID=A0A0L8AM43_9BACT|nr:hypothetical protein [Roseivirga seohaensis]KOF03282.1 hypothetical protein OB69_08285 [Roseivirga seohaensis subsp. aquiponti]
MRLAILITNPNHHLELTIDVAKLIKAKGHQVTYISLCELRRMASPEDVFKSEGLDYIKFGSLPQNLKPSSGKQTLGKSDSKLRALVRLAFWLLKLKPFIKKSLLGFDKVLLMNDAAFPGDKICTWLKANSIPFYLLQEGIRFPLPNETETKYGANGAEKVMAWGERSAKHFRTIVSPGTEVVVTGSPRFNKFLEDVRSYPVKDANKKVLGVFTNPIDDQGFCSHEAKLELFERFVQRAAPQLKGMNIQLGIKCHPREDVQEYLTIANKYLPTIELPKSTVEAILAVDVGVIMASTVGLELLGAKRKIAQLEIPNYGYVFDYHESADVLKIPVEGDFDLSVLFGAQAEISYFYEHIAIGNAAQRITSVLTE